MPKKPQIKVVNVPGSECTTPGHGAFGEGLAVGGRVGEGGEVGRLVDCGQAEDRRMIRAVAARPLLYARSNMPVASYYTHVKRLWEEVAAEMGWSVADVRRKWSHVRNSYSRHLRNELQGARTGRGRMVSRWHLADELDFLRDHMATDLGTSDLRNNSDVQDQQPLMVRKSKHHIGFEGRSTPYPSTPTFAPHFLELGLREAGAAPAPSDSPAASAWFAPPDDDSTGFAPEENSTYFQFFRGIHSDYQELSTQRQRQFRRQCLELLHRLLDEQESGSGRGGQADQSALSANGSQSAHSAGSDDERELKVFAQENHFAGVIVPDV